MNLHLLLVRTLATVALSATFMKAIPFDFPSGVFNKVTFSTLQKSEKNF
jgi:hypothetical protein